MDLFPYILVRKAGISQKLLAAPTIDSSFLKSIDQSEKKYHSFKENFIQYIDEIIQINESPCIRVHLINIRRAISNNKKVNQKDLIRITTHSFKVELLNKIASFKQLHLNKQESISVYNNAFSDAQVAEVSHLFKCKENPNLLNALLFSSPQFFERLNRIKFDVRIFNKKTRQTYLKLLEYLSRGAYKTSPFSSLGKVGFYDLQNRVGLTPLHQQVIYSNHELTSNEEVSIGLNPTLFGDEKNYYYFTLENNIQELIRTPQTELLSKLFNAKNSSKKINTLDETTKNQLIKDRFLIQSHTNHNIALSNLVNKIQSIPIENIKVKKNQLERLKASIKSSENEKPLVYEDCFYTPMLDKQKSIFEAISKELNQLTKILAPLHFFSMREKIFKFLRENIEEDQAINFIELVESIKELPADYLKEETELKRKERQLVQNHIEKILNKKNEKSGIIKFSFEDLAIKKTEVEANYFAAHFQTETIENKTIVIVNSISNGAGKLFGRFTNQFPTVASDLKQYIYKNANGYQLVLNQDFSTSPVNSHPPIIEHKIALPTNNEGSISPGELFASYNLASKAIYLIDEKANDIKVINLGVEAEHSRDYFYPYLTAFTGTRCVISPLLELINNIAYRQNQTIYQLPRVEIGNHLILQRKSWHIQIDSIPTKEKGETDADFYLKIQGWVQKNKLPKQVFIKTSSTWFSKNVSRENKVGHKPQFIDFSKIGFVSLFNKKLQQVNDYLEMTELLPDFINKNMKIEEYAIEWFG